MICATCGFEFYHPLGKMRTLTVGLYDDGRFPGRLIASLNAHHENFEKVPPGLLSDYMGELQTLTQELSAVTGSSRVNLAVLGNAEAHVHAHLIPRYPLTEAHPSKSPWNDPRPLIPLPDREAFTAKLIAALNSLTPIR